MYFMHNKTNKILAKVEFGDKTDGFLVVKFSGS